MRDINFERLKRDRLARFQAAMKKHGLAVALLYNPANIRYVTGTDIMSVWTASTFARYSVVPQEGRPLLFEYPGSVHVSQRTYGDARPALSWNMSGHEMTLKARRWAEALKGLLGELGAGREPLAVDKLDATGYLALAGQGIRIVDVNPASLDARMVKTRDELDLFMINGNIGDAVMAEFEAAIRPGIREYELLAVLTDALLRRHGEGMFARLVASGTNTNPWMSEAHDKMVRSGDLVGVDTDMNGYEGYLIDFSRTFLCGNAPTAEQTEAYRVAHDCVTGMAALIEPGLSFRAFGEAAPRLPEGYVPNRYGGMLHHAGLEDEGPFIPYPYGEGYDDRIMPEGAFEEGMVVCLECFAGKSGASQGAKLEDQGIVTAQGFMPICTYPFDAKLLGDE